MSRFTLAIASGKGGTGKTTLSVSLALALRQRGETVRLIDHDVEEPNSHLFLNQNPQVVQTVTKPIPQVDEERCTGCGLCREACAFNAIAILGGKPLVFAELCHGCGGCTLACPEKAITEFPKELGVVEQDENGDVPFMQGRMNVGEAMAVPIIRALRKHRLDEGWTILDAPPGTSCPVVESVAGVDAVWLVTEPTPFGLNDLRLAVELTREMGIPAFAIVNRSDMGDRKVFDYLNEERIPLILEIPYDTEIARAYAEGRPMITARENLVDDLVEAARRTAREVRR